MGQGLLHLDPLVRVKGQHLVQQVQSCSTKDTSAREELMSVIHVTREEELPGSNSVTL